MACLGAEGGGGEMGGMLGGVCVLCVLCDDDDDDERMEMGFGRMGMVYLCAVWITSVVCSLGLVS